MEYAVVEETRGYNDDEVKLRGIGYSGVCD